MQHIVSIPNRTEKLLTPDSSVSFADVAHQTLTFESNDPISRLILSLIDTRWVQRLRHVKQTGNTNLVYMYAEHSRFGHSLGVAYLAMLLMDRLARIFPETIKPYRAAVTAAALLHDTGHCAPGSHLAARMWGKLHSDEHEHISTRVVLEDPEINSLLRSTQEDLPEKVSSILKHDPALPPWTKSIISGTGWNADRGNWTIVDSAMCSVSYGRYNVRALIDAFRLSSDGHLVIRESRLDALTHFFVARESMYRQVYQHRVLQSADALMLSLIRRLRDIIGEINAQNIFCDNTMHEVLISDNYAHDLPLDTIFEMTEGWWSYHVERWCSCNDEILRDLAIRLRDRKLFKTVRSDLDNESKTSEESPAHDNLLCSARKIALELGYDPAYYVLEIHRSTLHKEMHEQAPLVLLDNAKVVPVTEVEPLISSLINGPGYLRKWIAVPKEIKEKLGRSR